MNFHRSLKQVCVVVALLAIAPNGAVAQADKYPDKPIRIIVPYPPGGSGDVVARAVGQKLLDSWGQQVVVDNRPGASGMIGTEHVARSAPDGYTLLLGTDIQFAINPVLYSKVSYDPDKDFEPLALGAVINFVVAVPGSLQVNSLNELVALAKSRPGQLSYGSAGSGSTHHLAMELIKLLAGISVTHIPYKGGAQGLVDLLSGRVQMMYIGFSQVQPHIKSGKLKVLAVGSAKRLRSAPEIPMVAETFPGFETDARWDFYAPAGTPGEIVRKLSTEIIKILNTREVVEQLSSRGLDVLGGNAAQLTARNHADAIKWRRVTKEAGIKVE